MKRGSGGVVTEMGTWRWMSRTKARIATLSIVVVLVALAFAGYVTTRAYAPTHGAQPAGARSGGASSGLLQPGPGDWTRFDYDAARSGRYPLTSISPANVSGLHKLWSVSLPSVADSTPIYLHHMRLADGTVHDILYV